MAQFTETVPSTIYIQVVLTKMIFYELSDTSSYALRTWGLGTNIRVEVELFP